MNTLCPICAKTENSVSSVGTGLHSCASITSSNSSVSTELKSSKAFRRTDLSSCDAYSKRKSLKLLLVEPYSTSSRNCIAKFHWEVTSLFSPYYKHSSYSLPSFLLKVVPDEGDFQFNSQCAAFIEIHPKYLSGSLAKRHFLPPVEALHSVDVF